jgi:hypothetical protein
MKDRDNDVQNLEQGILDNWSRLNDPTTQKKAEREMYRSVSRARTSDPRTDPQTLARMLGRFEERWELKKKNWFPPGTPEAFREAFFPVVERVLTLPPVEQRPAEVVQYWTEEMFQFWVRWPEEVRDAMIQERILRGLLPPTDVISQIRAQVLDSIEQARLIRELAERCEADVALCLHRAKELFQESLFGRLRTVILDTCQEVAIRAIGELAPELNEDVETALLRKARIDELAQIEKERLDTRAPGAPTSGKQYFENLLNEAQQALHPLGLGNNKTAVVEYINRHHPKVRCSSVRQLDRLLERHALGGKFPPDKGKTRRGRRRQVSPRQKSK